MSTFPENHRPYLYIYFSPIRSPITKTANLLIRYIYSNPPFGPTLHGVPLRKDNSRDGHCTIRTHTPRTPKPYLYIFTKIPLLVQKITFPLVPCWTPPPTNNLTSVYTYWDASNPSTYFSRLFDLLDPISLPESPRMALILPNQNLYSLFISSPGKYSKLPKFPYLAGSLTTTAQHTIRLLQ